MTTITEKITTALDILKCIPDPSEFLDLATLIKNDLLGFSKTIPFKKAAKRYGVEPEELELAFDSLAYLILHIAKVKANEQEFDVIFEQSGLP